jgi:2-polyprenyl-3-methyl-5-hydroxy-6-metoxy-1,4-benzoquinol methylase
MNLAPQLLAAAERPITWEEVPCPLCDSPRWQTLVEAPDPLPGERGLWFAVVQCQSCGLCFTNPRPDTDSIRRFYPPAYRPHQVASTEVRRRRERRPPRLPRGLIRQHLPLRSQSQNRLLDFGCGGGSFLEQMRRLGWQVTGVDIATTAVERLRQDLGLRALTGSLPHPELRPGSFDAVTMWHALEHVHVPRVVLKAAYDLLVPGGRLIVAVPNIDSLPFRWFGAAWCGLDLPRHLTHFDPATLVRILMQSGFEIDALRLIRHSSWLRRSAGLACERGRKKLRNRLLWFKPFSRLASWYGYLTGQSDAMLAAATKPASPRSRTA